MARNQRHTGSSKGRHSNADARSTRDARGDARGARGSSSLRDYDSPRNSLLSDEGLDDLEPRAWRQQEVERRVMEGRSARNSSHNSVSSQRPRSGGSSSQALSSQRSRGKQDGSAYSRDSERYSSSARSSSRNTGASSKHSRDLAHPTRNTTSYGDGDRASSRSGGSHSSRSTRATHSARGARDVRSNRGGRDSGGSRVNKIALLVAFLFVAIIGGAFAFTQLVGSNGKLSNKPAANSTTTYLTTSNGTTTMVTSNPGWEANITMGELNDPEVTDGGAKIAEAKLLPTPIIAQCGDVDIHLPVTTADLTEIVFHQSATDWVLVMTTELPKANAGDCDNNRGTNRPKEQPTGDNWLNGSAFHIWRTKAWTPMDTSVDCGAPIGSTAYSPVTGEVTRVRTYTLEGVLQDYCIHITPDGHPEMDVCMLHTTNVLVEPGDHVEAGVTPISEVRDIESYIGGIQLEPYTPAGDGGNHVHVQVNDRNYSGYPY